MKVVTLDTPGTKGLTAVSVPARPSLIQFLLMLVLLMSLHNTSNVHASTDEPSLVRFEEAVQEENWQAARPLSGELRDQYEGTARFDFHYALLLLHDGQTQEAVFALERVLAFTPKNHRARVELARAYFHNNNLARSRTEFERVLATDPPDAVRGRINHFLDRIAATERARNRQFNAYITLEGGWDSNINDGSNLTGELAPNLLGLTTLKDSSKAVDSAYGRLRLGAQWVRPTSLKSTRTFGLEAYNVQFPGYEAFSQSGLSSRYRLHYGGERLRSQLTINGGYTWIDGEPWQLSGGLGGQITLAVQKPLWLGLTAHSNLGFAQSSDRDHSANTALGMVLTADENQRSHGFFSRYIQYSLSGGDNAHLEWRGLSNQYNLGWQWSQSIRTRFSLRHDIRDYQGDDLLFTEGENTTERKRRRDQYLSSDAALTWQPRDWLRSRSGIGFELLDSNINAYSRDQWVISQSLTLQF